MKQAIRLQTVSIRQLNRQKGRDQRGGFKEHRKLQGRRNKMAYSLEEETEKKAKIYKSAKY